MKPKYVELDHASFMYYIRANSDKFFRVCAKRCSCDPGDLRLENGIVECGQCGAKLVFRNASQK